ncbi:MAG: hypothetical protein ACRYGM_14870 [Janthinobacterium lividum]
MADDMNPAPRCAVVDLGSNSVRLVVFEGRGRNPVAIFNEKAVLRLGRGMQSTGRLNEQGVEQALRVMARYAAVARAMGADPFAVLATAAVRDATNGAEFVAAMEAVLGGVKVQVLSGPEEARLSADGMLCGIPGADGLLADIGGGSLELVRLDGGGVRHAATLRLGVIRLSERSGGDMQRARSIAEDDLAELPWLQEAAGRDLFLVGGAWRALARVHMQHVGYPLGIVHHYTIDAEAARGLASLVLDGTRKGPRRRAEDLPYAATVLRRLLRQSDARRVVFSANGIREGWFMQQVSAEVRREDPLLAAAQEMARHLGRDPGLPPVLIDWVAPLFPTETASAMRLRHAACWMSDIGSHDHPEYRAEQAFWRVLRQPGVGLSHPSRAFLAMAVGLRYEPEAEAGFLATARTLLDPAAIASATILGTALRLAYILSAGTPTLLANTALRREPGRLVLRLGGGGGAAGDGMARRLERLATAVGLVPAIETQELTT